MSDEERALAVELPEWAGALGEARYVTFLELVRADLLARGASVRFADGVAEVRLPVGSEVSCGLASLAQLCSRLPVPHWEELMSAHFDALFEGETELGESLDRSHVFAEVRHLLKLRLHPLPLPQPLDGVVWHVADGLGAVLVFDLPQTVRSVRAGEAEGWGIDHGELRALALAQSLNEPCEDYAVEGRDGCRVTAMSGESFFVATRLLALEREVPLDHPNGALVAVPTRHSLLLHLIEDLSVVHALHTLLPMAAGLHRDGPGSLSPAVYWWRGGELRRLDASIGDAGVHFAPSREFAELLERLAAPNADEPT
jgi:hypothetical protein